MSLGDKMFKGVAWSAVERLSIQSVQFIIQIALARILSPEEYGIMGILYVFIAISLVFIDSGFTKALIQKKDRNSRDISTIFFFNIGISVVAYLLLFVAAPFVSEFYSSAELTPLLRVLAITLFINALIAVPITLYTIELDFKSLTKINFIAAVISGAIGYYMAYTGYGVWSLVGLNLSKATITALLTWLMLDWRPAFIFSQKSLKELFSFGSNLLFSSLLNVSVNKIYELIIPKVNSLKDLGYYTRGTQFSDTAFGIINAIFERVLLPGLTDIQDQLELLVQHTRKIIRAASLVVVPIFFLLALIAEPLIRVLLTEKWMPAVPIMQLFCLARLITILSGINVNLLYVIGRSDLALRQQYFKLAIRAIFLIIAVKYGIYYIALAELISTSIHFFINTYYPGKYMGYGALKQIKDIMPVFIAALLMVISIFVITIAIENDIVILAVSILSAAPIYFMFIRFFKIDELTIIITKTKNLLKGKL